MATFQSQERINATKLPPVPTSPGGAEGRLRMFKATVPAGHGNAFATDDLVELGVLPKDALPIACFSRVTNSMGPNSYADILMGVGGVEIGDVPLAFSSPGFVPTLSLSPLAAETVVVADLKNISVPTGDFEICILYSYA